jgi:hypothetical protein
MDWVGAYHYVTILQEERLQQAAKSGGTMNLTWARNWLNALRELFAVRECVSQGMALQECIA